MQKLSINVKGMHCKSCEMVLKEELEELEGVRSAQASHTEGKVNLEYDPDKASTKRMIEIITNQGFQVNE